MLINLLDNAIKFTGKADGRVSVSLKNGRAMVKVKDNGIGYPGNTWTGFSKGVPG